MSCNWIQFWLQFLLIAIVWPLAVWLWTKRKVASVNRLEIHLVSHEASINGTQYPGIIITFANKTGSVVYLSNARLRERPRNLAIHPVATRNISDSSCQLRFRPAHTDQNFDRRQIILQTDQDAQCWLPLVGHADDALFTYRPTRWLGVFRISRYFRMTFLAVVGDARCRVSLPYWDTAPTPTGFAEIVSDDFPILHVSTTLSVAKK